VKKQLEIILFSWFIIGFAQGDPNLSLVPAAAPRISEAALQLQADEVAWRKSSLRNRPVYTYALIKNLNTIPVNSLHNLDQESSIAEIAIVARAVMATALSDQNTFPDMVIFFLCSHEHQATSMAYIAISAWAYELEVPGSVDTRVDAIVAKYAADFDNHWLAAKDSLLPFFRRQLKRFHDISAAIKPEVMRHMRERKKEEIYTSWTQDNSWIEGSIDEFPSFYRGIYQTIGANLGRINEEFRKQCQSQRPHHLSQKYDPRQCALYPSQIDTESPSNHPPKP